jgi:Arc/MetJ family transcription regulator
MHRSSLMRTTLDLDKKLLDEAMKWTGESTKTSVINEALKEIIKNRKRLRLVEMAGKINLEVDINITRSRT